MSWHVLSQRVLVDAPPWLKLFAEHVRLPNGVEIPEFYRIEMASYVVIFAITEDEQVALVEHYKHGPGMVSLELPAGYIENDDDPLATAQRELREEAGLVSENWKPLGRYFIDGNRGCGWMYGFLAKDARRVGAQQLEDTEIMTLHFKSLDDVYNLWRGGQMTNSAIMGLIGYALVDIGYLEKKNDF